MKQLACSKILILVCCLVLPNVSFAQEETKKPATWSDVFFTLHLGAHVAQKPMSYYLPNPGFHLESGLMIWHREKPLALGMQFGLGLLANRSLDVDLMFEDSSTVLATDMTRSKVLHGHTYIRYYPFESFAAQLYVDALLGVRRFSTRSQLTRDAFEDESTESSTVTISTDKAGVSYTPSFGFAIGTHLRLPKTPWLAIDLKCSYLSGGRAAYFAPKTKIPPLATESIALFQERKTAVPALLLQVGTTMDLNY